MNTDVQERMPGDAEAAAAVAALNPGWSVGDRLHFAIPGERNRAARVALIRECDGWLCVEAEDGSGIYSIHPDWARGF